ncbi:hypothetical protein DFH05DRAFT_1477373 [Lentinula detonsa]|uniref:Uncharacterized protein n=1 Tax=Lentinula detonsa TaxID=2804962 RepID=A0A9W8P9P5_9AGAR|nr:hypothetical protein DFH05DRAFT_1477373 [Lentinula detonsa]KAJ3982783.1 hypothetical protein F5890DRAFT_1527691 [Lentinula detonsa]
MRLSTYLVLGFALASAAFTAPLTTRDSAMVDIRTPASYTKITIDFEENPLEGIHTHLTIAYTNAIKEDVRKLIKNIAARDLGAPVGSAILFTWIGTPSPDASKPVKYDVSTEEYGRYKVVMSHKTPMTNVIVTDSLGRSLRKLGDPYRNP